MQRFTPDAWAIWRLYQFCTSRTKDPETHAERPYLNLESLRFVFAEPELFDIEDKRQVFDDLQRALGWELAAADEAALG